MSNVRETAVTVIESGNGPYGQFVTAGRHVMGADEPDTVGGHDTGPSPYEYLLAGLGACTAMTVRMYAQRHDWSLTQVKVSLRHIKAVPADGTAASDRFERILTLSGELTDEQKARLLAIAEKCPVTVTLKRASDVVARLA